MRMQSMVEIDVGFLLIHTCLVLRNLLSVTKNPPSIYFKAIACFRTKKTAYFLSISRNVSAHKVRTFYAQTSRFLSRNIADFWAFILHGTILHHTVVIGYSFFAYFMGSRFEYFDALYHIFKFFFCYCIT